MRFNDVYSAVQDAKTKVATASQFAYANKLLSKKKKDLFKSFDKNITGAMAAVVKTQGNKFPKYKYQELVGRTMAIVDEAFVKNSLVTQQTSLVKLVDTLKEENYKIVDPASNKMDNLKPASKKLFTAALSDLESLVELF